MTDIEPTNPEPTNSQPLSLEEVQAKAAILAESGKLAAAGVTFVAVHLDGYGDSGVSEEVRCFDSEYYAYDEHKPVAHDAAYLQEHFETVERNDRFEDYTTSSYEV
jgi:hypothetical protein